MKETMKKITMTMRLGNLSMTLDDDKGSRAMTAMRQDHLLDLIDLFIDACEVSEKEEKK